MKKSDPKLFTAVSSIHTVYEGGLQGPLLSLVFPDEMYIKQHSNLGVSLTAGGINLVQERTDRFDPPEEGMLPGEEIVWTRKAGSVFWIIFCGACTPMLPLVILPFAYEILGELGGILIIALTILVMIYILVSFINLRRTRYYLTSERIIEVRGGNIRKEIPLERFSGRPLGQFFESHVTHTQNDRPIFRIRIYDPMSDEILTLKGLDEHSAMIFERIGDRIECPYCNYDNTALSQQCKNCDAVL